MKDLEATPPPWREKGKAKETYENAKLKATNERGQNPTMYVPPSKPAKPSSRKPRPPSSKLSKKFTDVELDSELRYTFQRNFQFLQKVFSLELLLRPLPDPMGHTIRRNVGFLLAFLLNFGIQRGLRMPKNLWD